MNTTKTSTTRPAMTRVHVSLEVSRLEPSLAFYGALLGVPPSKQRPGYAKFEPEDPPVHLSLVEGPAAGPPRGAGHFGVQVASPQAVRAAAERLAAAGLEVREDGRVSCCYSVQEKLWVRDPDGAPWEVFAVVEPDSPDLAPRGATCCAGGGGCA